MGFLRQLARWGGIAAAPFTFGASLAATGASYAVPKKKKEDPYAQLMATLKPLIDTQARISSEAGDSGLANIATATRDYTYVSDYLKKLFEGSDDELLKLLDAGDATRSLDENFQQTGELGVRGGQRAASMGQANFNRDAALSRLLAQLRNAAPDKIANIAQGIGNLGLGTLGASTGSAGMASNIQFGFEQIKDADEDRRAQLIAGIFSAIGSAAGAAVGMCVAIGDSFILTPEGNKPLYLTKLGDEVCSFNKKSGDPIIRIVKRIRISEKEEVVRIVSQGNRIIKPTDSHAFYNTEFEEINCEDLTDDDLLVVSQGPNLQARPIKLLGDEVTKVMIIKLDDEEDSYPMIINNFVCADDYVLGRTK